MTAYVLSPLAVVSRDSKDGGLVVHGGDGFDRQRIELDSGPGGEHLLAWLLTRTDPASAADLAADLAEVIGLDGDSAGGLIGELRTAHVLIDENQATAERRAMRPWAAHGWDDAALFHRSTAGQRFDPDTLAEVSYEDYYRWLASTPDVHGEQPPAIAEPREAAVRLEAAPTGRTGFADVLGGSAPINRFTGPPIAAVQLSGIVGDAFRAQRTVGGLLGEHLLKPYPSGGARHPLELYVISKTVDGLPSAVYRVHSLSGELHRVPGGAPDGVSQIDAMCFGKGGIVTADAVLVFTVRWRRHNWKYRYSRSYRMVLLEVGHAVQALHLGLAP